VVVFSYIGSKFKKDEKSVDLDKQRENLKKELETFHSNQFNKSSQDRSQPTLPLPLPKMTPQKEKVVEKDVGNKAIPPQIRKHKKESSRSKKYSTKPRFSVLNEEADEELYAPEHHKSSKEKENEIGWS